MLSNAFFVAKFRFDTAENEPAKSFCKIFENAFFENAFSPSRSWVIGRKKFRAGLGTDGLEAQFERARPIFAVFGQVREMIESADEYVQT